MKLEEQLQRIEICLQRILILLSRQQNATFIEDPNQKLTKEKMRKEYYPLLEPTQFDATDEVWKKCCDCGNHKHGELTGGWMCPVHGQQF